MSEAAIERPGARTFTPPLQADPSKPPARRVAIAGATGLIGKELCKALATRGYAVTVLSRDPAAARRKATGAAEYITWGPNEVNALASLDERAPAWAATVAALSGVHAIVNLAGAPVFGRRWSEAYKREIRDSRILGTRALVNALRSNGGKPAVFINGSAVGYYGFRADEALDESAPAGNDFLARVCQDWEAEALKAEDAGIRTVVVRTGIVLDRDEGALPQLRLPFRFYAGGPVLPGTQWFSWIHVADEVGIILLALENERARGPLNATAPQPRRNHDFVRTLGQIMGSPAWAPVPGFALKLLLGEVGDMLTEGQRVIPKRAQELGYQFQYPTSEAALRQLLTT